MRWLLRLLSLAVWAPVLGQSPDPVSPMSAGEDAAALQSRVDAMPIDALGVRLRLQTSAPGRIDATRVYERLTARAGAWELSAVAERDPGERRWLDHAVAYAHWCDAGQPVEMAVGHVQPAFGQGLLFGRGASLGVPEPRVRNDGATLGYRSTTESGVPMGVVLRGRHRGWVAGLVAGRARHDARLDTAGTAVSLPQGGLHAGSGEALRDRLGSTVVGARLAVEGDGSRLGFTGQHLTYDRRVDLRRPGRVADAFTGHRQWAGAIDGVWRRGRMRLYAAVARAGGSGALVAGIDRLEVSTVRIDGLARAFGGGFHSPFGAAASGNDMHNERGVTLRGRWRGWVLWLDETRHPAPRWTEPVPGGARSIGLRGAHRPSSRLRVEAEVQRRRRSKWTADTARRVTVDRARLRARWTPRRLEAAAQVDGARSADAVGCAAGLVVRRRGPRLDLTLHGTRFRTDGYDARLYGYERGLPGTVSIPPLYGDGWRLNGVAGVRLGPLWLWARGRLEIRAREATRYLCGLQAEIETHSR